MDLSSFSLTVFKMAAVRHLGFSSKVRNFNVHEVHGVICATIANFVAISRTTAEIWRLFDFLANVNSGSRSLYTIARPSVCRLSVVCNVRAPYSSGYNFRQYFYGITYLVHPLTSTKNFTEIVPGKPLRRGS